MPNSGRYSTFLRLPALPLWPFLLFNRSPNTPSGAAQPEPTEGPPQVEICSLQSAGYTAHTAASYSHLASSRSRNSSPKPSDALVRTLPAVPTPLDAHADPSASDTNLRDEARRYPRTSTNSCALFRIYRTRDRRGWSGQHRKDSLAPTQKGTSFVQLWLP